MLSSAERQEAIGDLQFSNKWRTTTLQPDLEFDNVKRHPERDIFEWIFWLYRWFFSSDYHDILKEEIKTYLPNRTKLAS